VNKLQTLIARNDALLKEMRALVDKKEALTDEEVASYEAKEKEYDENEKEIARLQKLADLESKASETREPVNKPVTSQPGSTSEPKQFASLGEQLRAIVIAEESRGQNVDSRLIYNQLGMSEGVPGDGGYLVQQEFSRELLKRAYETGILGNLCRRQPIGPGANGFKINVVDESSRKTGSRMGGIQMYWTGEGRPLTESQPKFRQLELSLQKLTGLLYATDELMADTVALETFIMDAFAEEYGFMVDDAIINGSGAGQPLGIMQSNALVTVPAEAGQPAGTVVFENLSNMWGRLPARSRRNAAWLINQEVEPQLDRLALAVGVAALEARFVTYGPDGVLRIKGRPVMAIEQAEALGTPGDVILADLSQYLLIDKGPMESAVSIHVRFVWDEQTFRFIYRVNGQPIWNRPLTPYKGAGSQSPFVALAAR
jgi:HK97 family phage major capsid protein